MCIARKRLASSMNGLFSLSVRSFQSAPRRLLISELCILGFSWAIFLRWPRDQTMKAFIGRFTRSWSLALLFFAPGAEPELDCGSGVLSSVSIMLYIQAAFSVHSQAHKKFTK